MKFDSLDNLKRGIYLWILPFVTLAVIINIFMSDGRTFDVLVNGAALIWFIFSWFWAYLRKGLQFGEFSNLLLVSIYLIMVFYDVIHNNLARTGTGSLGDFIVWVPLYIVFIFITLGIQKGLLFSIVIFLIALFIGIRDIKHLSPESIDSVSQFYFANIVYILVLYFAQHIFKAYTEVNVLKRYAYIDSLTRIANRHQIDVWLEQKLVDAEGQNKPFSIIFFDIDHFKKVNDHYGHKIGDCVLQEIAAIVSGFRSKGDLLGRWGGEEFILISDAADDHALEKAEQIRELVEKHTFNGAGKLTASFGVTDFKCGDNIDSLLNRADEALYVSKNNGRNKVSRK